MPTMTCVPWDTTRPGLWGNWKTLGQFIGTGEVDRGDARVHLRMSRKQANSLVNAMCAAGLLRYQARKLWLTQRGLMRLQETVD